MSYRVRQRIRDAVIGWFVVLALIDLFPRNVLLGVDTLDRIVARPFLSRFGLMQNDYALFAPNPGRDRVRIDVLVRYSDGETARWTPPDLRQRGFWERLADYQLMRWQTHVSGAFNTPFHHGLARWAANNARPNLPEDVKAEHVTITRYLWQTPLPGREYRAQVAAFGKLPPAPEHYEHESVLFAGPPP